MRILDCAQMRQAEAYAMKTLRVPGQTLMERAGKAVADFVLDYFHHDLWEKKITVLCAKGNNAGDGFAAARRLLGYGADVCVVLTYPVSDLSADAAVMFDKLSSPSVRLLRLENEESAAIEAVFCADLIIDAMFGTGFHGEVPPFLEDIFSAVNDSEGFKVAVDAPSGVNLDYGVCAKYAIKADVSVTFHAPKLGMYLPGGYDLCGEIQVADIGIPECDMKGARVFLTQKEEVSALLPKREKGDNKGSFGRVLCLAGSDKMPGAAVMAASSAVSSGTGTVVMGVPSCLYYGMSARVSEAMILPLPEKDGALSVNAIPQIIKALPQKGAVLLGPGLSGEIHIQKIVDAVIENSTAPIIIDADGINALSRNIDSIKKAKVPIVLTPHPGEMARLTGKSVEEIQKNRISTARDFAAAHHVTLLLKGANTVIAGPFGEVYINPTGNPSMAKGGSGDVLSGIVAAFLSQGLSGMEAALCAAYIHGLAGDEAVKSLSIYGVTPSHMIGEIGRVLSRF